MARIETTITEINKPGPIKPRSPLYSIVNDSFFDAWIDNYKLSPGATFNIDAGPVVAEFLKVGVPVTNETTYNIKFDTNAPNLRHALQLVELFIRE